MTLDRYELFGIFSQLRMTKTKVLDEIGMAFVGQELIIFMSN